MPEAESARAAPRGRSPILGFLTASIADIERAARLGFKGVELDVSAFGNPKEGALAHETLAWTKSAANHHQITITALAYYGLALDPPDEAEIINVYDRVFDAAEDLGVQTIASMSGFDADLDWNANVALFTRRFRPLVEHAEARGLRLALENWMGFSGQLPFRPTNMGGSPATWSAWFDSVPSAALGLEFDPSHLYWQGIDPVRALRDFRERVYHVHAKDIETLPEQRYWHGINGDSFRFRIPGYGEIDWVKLVSTLIETGYAGGIAIEHEDEVFGYPREQSVKPSRDLFDEGLLRARCFLAPLVEGPHCEAAR